MKFPCRSMQMIAALIIASPTLPAAEKSAEKKSTIITSQTLEIDYERDVSVFSGAVHVRDVDGEMWADRMEVTFNPESRDVRKVVSEGDEVIIVTKGKRSKSKKAVYTAAKGTIVLTGNARITQGRNTYGADTITIFKNSGKTLFEPRARLILYSESEAQEALEEIF